MSDARSQEELAGGFLQVALGGSTRQLPTLKIRAEREWKLELARSIGERQLEIDLDALKSGGEATYAALAPLASMANDAILDLVVSYDKSGALGGREWLEEHADSAQLYAVLQRILRVAFPFVSDLRGALSELRQLVGLTSLVRSASSSSTNGDSPTGDSPPSPSKKPSTPNS